MSSSAIRRDRVFNFFAALTDAVGWPVGMAFFSLTTIFPPYLRHLGASDFTIGALNALLNLLAFLPGLFIVARLRRLSRVRGHLLAVALVERLALLPLVPLTLLWGRARPDLLLIAVFCCVTVHGIALGLNQPAYWVLIGKTIPAHWRGRLYGYAGGIAGLLGIGTDWVLRHIVFAGSGGGFPGGYARGFLIGFCLLTATVVPLGLMREPHEPSPHEADEPPVAGHHALRALWNQDGRFRRLLRVQALFALTGMAAPFYVLYATEHLGAGVGAVAGYTAAQVYAGAFGSLLAGWFADRLGNRRVLLLGALCQVITGAVAVLAGGPFAFYSVFIGGAVAAAALGISANNLVLEYAGSARQIGLYSAAFNLLSAVPRAAGPLLGGLLAGSIGYVPLFALSGTVAVGALILALRVSEDR